MIQTDYQVINPAYGRDYKSKAEAITAFQAGFDFILQPQGVYCSKRDFAPGVIVNIRYKRMTQVTPHKVI